MKYIQSFSLFESSVFIKGFKKNMSKLYKVRGKIARQLDKLQDQIDELNTKFKKRYIPLLDGQEVSYKSKKYKKLRTGLVHINFDNMRIGTTSFYVSDMKDKKGKKDWDMEYIQFSYNGQTYNLYANSIRMKYNPVAKIETYDPYLTTIQAQKSSIESEISELRLEFDDINQKMAQEFVLIQVGEPVRAYSEGKWQEGFFSAITFKNVNKDFTKFNVQFWIKEKFKSYKSDEVGGYFLNVERIKFVFGSTEFELDTKGNRTGRPK